MARPAYRPAQAPAPAPASAPAPARVSPADAVAAAHAAYTEALRRANRTTSRTPALAAYTALREGGLARRAAATLAKRIASEIPAAPLILPARDPRNSPNARQHLINPNATYNDSDILIAIATNTKRNRSPGELGAYDWFSYYADHLGKPISSYLGDRRMPKGKARVCVGWDLARGLITLQPARK